VGKRNAGQGKQNDGGEVTLGIGVTHVV
jgi:hypothetical protein